MSTANQIGAAVNSATSSRDIQIIRGTGRRSRHLSYGQIRGVIQLFRSYFDTPIINGRKRRMDPQEKKARWASYKKKMIEQYGRVIKGKFESEQAYIKRYSNPLEFLKYKLGRPRNLKLSDLKPSAMEYYKEIGGLDDVQELINQQANIDSVDKAAERLSKKRRFNELDSPALNTFDLTHASPRSHFNNHNFSNDHVSHSNSDNHNHRIHHYDHNDQQRYNNHNNHNNRFNQQNLQFQFQSLPPLSQAASTNSTQIKADPNIKIDNALDQLNDGLDVFEKELLEKKKSEAYQIATQKVNAIHHHLMKSFQVQPELIGCVVGAGNLEDQLNCAFDIWLKHHCSEIKQKTKDFEIFMDQVALAKQDQQEWSTFVSRWKTERILREDLFSRVWKYVQEYLNVEENSEQEIENDVDNDLVEDAL